MNDLQTKTKVLWQNRVGKLHVLPLPILQVFFAPQILFSATFANTFSTSLSPPTNWFPPLQRSKKIFTAKFPSTKYEFWGKDCSILLTDKSNKKKKKNQQNQPNLKQLLRKGLYATVSGLAFTSKPTSKPTAKYMFWLSANSATDPLTHVKLNLAKQIIATTWEIGHFTSCILNTCWNLHS